MEQRLRPRRRGRTHSWCRRLLNPCLRLLNSSMSITIRTFTVATVPGVRGSSLAVSLLPQNGPEPDIQFVRILEVDILHQAARRASDEAPCIPTKSPRTIAARKSFMTLPSVSRSAQSRLAFWRVRQARSPPTILGLIVSRKKSDPISHELAVARGVSRTVIRSNCTNRRFST